jgi:hypothetical protein
MYGIVESAKNFELDFNDEKIEEIYLRAVEEPNLNVVHEGFVRCPECCEEILMIPTLRVMGEAIENHVCKHREALKTDPVRAHRTAISVRLALVGQVLDQSCKTQVP